MKRIYGEFTNSGAHRGNRRRSGLRSSPVQQFAYTKGKNARDGTLIIDAMDLLNARKFDGLCRVTSDTDYTGLATWLREEGLMIFGFGERKMPDEFRNGCHKFVFTEVLRPASANDTPAPKRATEQADPASPKLDVPREFMLAALEESSDDSGSTFGG